jgi:hypothetical protein
MVPWPGTQASTMRGISLQWAVYSGMMASSLRASMRLRLHRAGAWRAFGALNVCAILRSAQPLPVFGSMSQACGRWRKAGVAADMKKARGAGVTYGIACLEDSSHVIP